MNCVGTTRAHLTEIKPLPFHQVDNWIETLDVDGQEGYLKHFCRTLLEDTQPVLIVGVQVDHPGVGELWAVYSTLVEVYKVAVVRHIQRLEAEAVKRMSLWRMQALCLVDFPPARCHLERLGFTSEGRLRSMAGPGIDCWLMAKVYE